jgi:hypothetical protein
MLKLTAVFLFVVMCSIVPLHAQSVPDVPAVKETRTETRTVTQSDLRQVFSNETQKLKSDSMSVDAKKMERLRLKQAKSGGWGKKETAFMVIFAIAVTVLVVLLVKYGKDCLRYENNCDPAFDENCYCEEYEQNEERRRR